MKKPFITFSHWTILIPRLILLIPFGSVILIVSVLAALKSIGYFLRYGFEYRVYQEPDPYKTIGSVYDYVKDKMEESN
jgi:hypothetical protein